MLHSRQYNKTANEDLKTSSVFENLLLLPDNVFWQIIRNACHDHHRLPNSVGVLNEYDFWPHWNSKGTDNSNYVEPDVFLQFEMLDVIVEAKLSDYQGQYIAQWKREIHSYFNEYGKDKDVILISIGGNDSMSAETVVVKKQSVDVVRCSWAALLVEVHRYYDQLSNITICDMSINSIKRLLENIIMAFNQNGVYNIKWFDSMLNFPHISSNSYNILQDNFQI